MTKKEELELYKNDLKSLQEELKIIQKFYINNINDLKKLFIELYNVDINYNEDMYESLEDYIEQYYNKEFLDLLYDKLKFKILNDTNELKNRLINIQNKYINSKLEDIKELEELI